LTSFSPPPPPPPPPITSPPPPLPPLPRPTTAAQTLGGRTDFDKIGFTVLTTEGKKASVYADRCGVAEAVVTDEAGKEVRLGALVGLVTGQGVVGLIGGDGEGGQEPTSLE